MYFKCDVIFFENTNDWKSDYNFYQRFYLFINIEMIL